MNEEKIDEEMVSERFNGMEADTSTLQLLLSPEYVLNKMRHALLGEVPNGDPRDNNWVTLREPIMSIEGVNDYMQVMENTIGIPQSLTSLTKKEMNTLLATVLNNSYDFVFFKSQKYDLKESNFSTLVAITEINCTTFLNKANAGFITKMIKGMFGMKENVSKNQSVKDEMGGTKPPSAPWMRGGW